MVETSKGDRGGATTEGEREAFAGVEEQLELPDEIRDEFLAIAHRVGGEFWGRGGLEPRARSLATMAVLVARGQTEELAIHVRLAQESFGLSRAEICELILHCGLYAGFPAALTGFRTAAREFARMDAEANEDR